MTDAVLSQPGDEVLITSGPLSKLIDSEAAESVMLETQAIRAVQVPGPISRLHVVDSSVCQVVCNGNRLFIVADQPGQTIIEANMGKHQKPLHMKVVVEKPWARGKSASVNLDQMQAIVSHLAPTAEITVQPSDEGSLIVTGFAESNPQAKKVLEAIRKMVLVPVVDRVEIR
jgi:Flp pilus assembly secretin CpaC